MTPESKAFLDRASDAAIAANHPFPRMAAAEAALESAWGKSSLAMQDNNLFGTKQHTHPVWDSINLPTREFEKGSWITVEAAWVKYPDWAACFNDRLATLMRLSPTYPHYMAALRARDAETYVREVSQTWSTDPNRAAKCISIYDAYLGTMSVAEVTA